MRARDSDHIPLCAFEHTAYRGMTQYAVRILCHLIFVLVEMEASAPQHQRSCNRARARDRHGTATSLGPAHRADDVGVPRVGDGEATHAVATTACHAQLVTVLMEAVHAHRITLDI